MHEVVWFLIITCVFTLISMGWAALMVLIHVVVTLIISFFSAKWAARPILNEAVRIRKGVFKAISTLTGFDVGKDIQKALAGRKGGSVRSDPIGDAIKNATGLDLKGMFGGRTKSSDDNRVLQIIDEEKRKRGIRSSSDNTGPTDVPVVR
jgi:hypothetical protein